MPRERKSRPQIFQTWIDSNPELFADVRIKDYDLYCVVCGGIINSSKKTNVTRHLNSHASINKRDLFFYELTEAFLASDIPLEKLNNPTLRHFLEKYMERRMPHPSTLRKGYINQVYDGVMKTIREDMSSSLIYFIVDEVMDSCGRSVVNFLIGALKSDTASDTHLVASKVLEETNHETIVSFVIHCFNYLWPHQNNSDKVLVMLTDAAIYMIKAAGSLSRKYPYMIHFTCSARALNRVAEKIKDCFPLVNKLVANITKIFVEAPTRTDAFKKVLPTSPLPPKPVVARWVTWLQAVAYYDEHFEDVKRVIYCFDLKGSMCVAVAQDLLKDQSLREDIKYINDNYGILINAITKLEKCGLSLSEQFAILNDVKKKINASNTRPVSDEIKEKMLSVFQRNPGYAILENIYKFLNGVYQELPPNILKYNSCISNFSNCPLAIVDVERTFSLHKLILNDRRQSLTPENLEKLKVVNFELHRRNFHTM